MNANSNALKESDIIRTPEADKIITVIVSEPTGTTLDGERFKQGDQVKISVKQWRALSRHFTWVNGPKNHAPITVNTGDESKAAPAANQG